MDFYIYYWYFIQIYNRYGGFKLTVQVRLQIVLKLYVLRKHGNEQILITKHRLENTLFGRGLTNREIFSLRRNSCPSVRQCSWVPWVRGGCESGNLCPHWLSVRYVGIERDSIATRISRVPGSAPRSPRNSIHGQSALVRRTSRGLPRVRAEISRGRKRSATVSGRANPPRLHAKITHVRVHVGSH